MKMFRRFSFVIETFEEVIRTNLYDLYHARQCLIAERDWCTHNDLYDLLPRFVGRRYDVKTSNLSAPSSFVFGK